MGSILLLPFTFGDRPAFLVALASDPAPTDPLTLLIGYGPLGIFLILLATGQFRTKYEVQGLEKQVEQLVAELHAKDELIRAFQIQLTGHALPALAQTARVFEAFPNTETDALGEIKRLQEQLAEQINSLKKREQS